MYKQSFANKLTIIKHASFLGTAVVQPFSTFMALNPFFMALGIVSGIAVLPHKAHGASSFTTPATYFIAICWASRHPRLRFRLNNRDFRCCIPVIDSG
jgi:hypothetical protein